MSCIVGAITRTPDNKCEFSLSPEKSVLGISPGHVVQLTKYSELILVKSAHPGLQVLGANVQVQCRATKRATGREEREEREESAVRRPPPFIRAPSITWRLLYTSISHSSVMFARGRRNTMLVNTHTCLYPRGYMSILPTHVAEHVTTHPSHTISHVALLCQH